MCVCGPGEGWCGVLLCVGGRGGVVSVVESGHRCVSRHSSSSDRVPCLLYFFYIGLSSHIYLTHRDICKAMFKGLLNQTYSLVHVFTHTPAMVYFSPMKSVASHTTNMACPLTGESCNECLQTEVMITSLISQSFGNPLPAVTLGNW